MDLSCTVRGGLEFALAAAAVTLVLVTGGACWSQIAGPRDRPGPDDETKYEAARRKMVTVQIAGRGVTDPAVLAALTAVPRHRFVPVDLRASAHDDGPLPIGGGQTISQPYIVGLMTALIRPRKDMRVLEIGTGSGYQAAVLSRCVAEVDTIEVLPTLGHRAEKLLAELGYRNIRVRIGDGHDGWPERAPFDAIVLTAAPPEVPRPLLEQLAVGGRLVAPVGRGGDQDLVVMTRTETGFSRQVVAPVAFVPMVGKAGGGDGPPRPD